MNKVPKHTPQITNSIRLEIGKMLIAHETIKLFPGLGDYVLIKNHVNSKWENLDNEIAIRNFWNLIDSITMGYELKDVVRIITSEYFNWRFEGNYLIGQLRFGWGEKAGNFELNGKTAKETAAYLKEHTDILAELKAKNKEKSPRTDDPIIVEEYSSDDSLHVHDGNGRLLRAIVNNQQALAAYIGTQISAPKSNHWVSTSFLQRLSDTLATDALVRVLRESDNAIFEFEDRVVTNIKQKVLEAL
jgi:hypothetical protein